MTMPGVPQEILDIIGKLVLARHAQGMGEES